MKTIGVKAALIALAMFFLLTASPALAKDKWIQLTTKNLKSSATPAKTTHASWR